MEQARSRAGNQFLLTVFRRPNLFLLDPQAGDFVLRSHAHVFTSREGNLDVASALFGHSVLYADGSEHRELRHALTPLFRRNGVLKASTAAAEATSRFINSERGRVPIDILDLGRALAMEVTLRSFVGDRRPRPDEYWRRRVEHLGAGLYSNRVSRIPLGRYARAERARRSLDVHLRVVQRQDDFSDSMRCLQEKFADRPRLLMDQLVTLLFAGYDTTSASIAWTAWYLACHPEWQDKLSKEISADSVQSPGVNRLVAEILRLEPPVYFIPRMASADVEYSGIPIPVGSLVNVLPLTAHRNARCFRSPHEFNPDRFIDGALSDECRPAYFPFGLGPKRCIGEKMAISVIASTIIEILRHGRLRRHSSRDPQRDFVSSLHPRRGNFVLFEPHSQERSE